MSIRAKVSLGAGVLAAALLLPAISQADIMGTAYMSANGGDASVVSGTEAATFTVPTTACLTAAQDLCFTSIVGSNNSANYTLGSFLGTGGATGITYMNGATAGQTFNNTILHFTGSISVTNGEVFTIAHDDGLTLTIGGNSFINDGGPTSPVTDNYTYMGPTGTFAFNLIYGECCGAPAVLDATLPTAVSTPEPSSLALLGVGLLGLGIAVTRRRRHNS